ncbi:MAG TPA: hypothetical protein VMN38_02570 [Sphingomicrobium sp.]|nr:hypothetical protein [Sphingomicrobium sp.]
MLIISAFTHRDPASLRKRRSAAILGILGLLTPSCGQSDTDTSTKLAYQLCPKSGDARAKLHELAMAYAAQQQAQVFDRGAEAQNELASMQSGQSVALRSTNLPLVLLTIEKPRAFRISITNVGLKEKFGLSVRLWNNSSGDSNAAAFLSQVERFWRIDKVQGGVSNDPPCPAS